MPAKSVSQQKLFGAALGGATFPAAKAIRASMSMPKIKEFAATKTKSLPLRVKALKAPLKPIRARGLKVVPTRRTASGDLYSAGKGAKSGI